LTVLNQTSTHVPASRLKPQNAKRNQRNSLHFMTIPELIFQSEEWQLDLSIWYVITVIRGPVIKLGRSLHYILYVHFSVYSIASHM